MTHHETSVMLLRQDDQTQTLRCERCKTDEDIELWNTPAQREFRAHHRHCRPRPVNAWMGYVHGMTKGRRP